ncbi:MAG: dihydrofolate reductase family protein [PVC group bacterium]
MQRPHLIVHTIASVDGRVSLGPNRTGFEDIGDERWQAIWSSETTLEDGVRELESLYHPGAFLEGSGSFVREGDDPAPLPLSEFDPEELYRDFLPDAVVRRPDHQGWFAAVDGRGRLRSGMKEFPGWEGWHTLHLVSRGAPPEYLAFLRRSEIPYLIAGQKQVDLKAVMEKMRAKLGVECVVSTAGSRLNGALLRAGLVDEVSLVLLPALIGGCTTPYLFASPDLRSDEWPTRLKLLSARGEPGGRVRLRYQVTRFIDKSG